MGILNLLLKRGIDEAKSLLFFGFEVICILELPLSLSLTVKLICEADIDESAV